MRRRAQSPREQATYTDTNDIKYLTDVQRLPAWLKTRCKTAEEAADAERNYFLMSTASNGDCLFHSIHLGLLSIIKQAYTSYELRSAVASSVLESSPEVNATLQNWRELLYMGIKEAQPEVIQEYQHARCLLREQPPFSHDCRENLRRDMLSPTKYWGDQYAIMVLERLLNVKLVILKKSKLMRRENAPDYYTSDIQLGVEQTSQFNPKWFIVLILDGAHFTPLVCRKDKLSATDAPRDEDSEQFVAAFKIKDIPNFVIRAFAAAT